MKSISAKDLLDLSVQAQAAPRLRRNLNLHDQLDDPVQRLCNALEPRSYVRPHRHPDGVWECFVLLHGACAILVFDDQGRVSDRLELSPEGATIAEIPAGSWHGVVALAPQTRVFEIKPGPYVPGLFCDWAPEEGDARAQACLDWLERAQRGESFDHG